jgi:hypothetical protein
MSIIRIEKKEKNFTIIDNTPIHDTSISWGAKGLLVYLLSLPNNWKINIEHLKNQAKNGRDSTNGKITELRKAGYIKRDNIIHKKEGKFIGYDYVVYETPLPIEERDTVTEKPLRVSRNGKTVTEKPKLTSTNTINTNEVNDAKASNLPIDNFSANKEKKEGLFLPKEKLDFIKKISAIVNINAKFPKENEPCSISLVNISDFIDDFISNGLLRYKFDINWEKRANINWNEIRNASTSERKILLLNAAKKYAKLKQDGYWPGNKKILAKSLYGFFLNGLYNEPKKSWILFCMFNKVKESGNISVDINYEKAVPKEVQEHVQKTMDYYKWDISTFKRNITSLYIWWRDYKDDLHLVNGGGFYSWGSNFNDLFDRMVEFFETWKGGVGLHNITHDSKSWDCFCNHIEEKYKVKLNPTAAEIEYARKQKEKWNEEDKRKSRYEELKQKKNVSDELAGYIEGGK